MAIPECHVERLLDTTIEGVSDYEMVEKAYPVKVGQNEAQGETLLFDHMPIKLLTNRKRTSSFWSSR